MSGALRHRGIEAWLEDSSGAPIPLTQAVDILSNNISTWVHIEPRKSYILRWRTFAGFPNISALCEVYINDGLLPANPANFRVARLVMDSGRRLTQSKSTKGWLNPPYRRFGCLRIRKRMGSGETVLKKSTNSTNSNPPLGSVRLKVWRVNGRIPVDPHWEKGPGEMDVSVIDMNTMDFLDDPSKNSPPWIVFEFKFKENPLVTARIEKENEDLKGVPTAESSNAHKRTARHQVDDTTGNSESETEESGDVYPQPSSAYKEKGTMGNKREISITPITATLRSDDRVDTKACDPSAQTTTDDFAPDKEPGPPARKRQRLSTDNRQQSVSGVQTPRISSIVLARSPSPPAKAKSRMIPTRTITPSPDRDDRRIPDNSKDDENAASMDDAMGNYDAVKLEEEELTLLLKRKTEAKQQNIRRLQRLLQE